jgi:hypothetical protein
LQAVYLRQQRLQQIPQLTDIFSKLVGLDTKVTAIKTTTDTNLDAKVTTRATPIDITNSQNAIIDNMGVKRGIEIHGSMDPGIGGHDSVSIIPASDGKVFTGHITGQIRAGTTDNTYANLLCEVGGGSISSDAEGVIVLLDEDNSGIFDTIFNTDFSCSQLTLIQPFGEPRYYDPPAIQYWISGEYTEQDVS